LQQRLERLNLGFPIEGSVSVLLENRIALLRGQVPAQSDGRTIERLLRMEPGVDDVRNELEIAPADHADVRTAATW
jgi:osmotically-inducible protein OsmY